MTVQKDLVKNVYVGNGSTTQFPYTFEVSENHPEFIKVYIVDENGISEETTNYTLDMSAKKITYPKTGQALESTKKIVIKRELPLEQQLNLENNGPYFADDIEQSLDDGVMISQQIAEQLSRALTMGIDVDGSRFNSTIPLVPGKSFRVNDDGTGLESTEDPAKVIPTAQSLLSQTTQQANIATQKATAAANSALSAADSEMNAETAMTQARNSATLAQKWAESATSPDNKTDTESPTGKTQSAKYWADTAKNIAVSMNQRFQFFTSLSQLSLEYSTVTFKLLADTLPANSQFVAYFSTSTVSASYAPNLQIPEDGLLIVTKGGNTAIPIKFIVVAQDTNTMYFGRYTSYPSDTFGGWEKVITDNQILSNNNKLLSTLFDFATQAEAEVGTNAQKPLNALRVAQAITKLAPNAVITESKLARPGYIVFNDKIIVEWGTGSISANTKVTINKQKPYTTLIAVPFDINTTYSSATEFSVMWGIVLGSTTTEVFIGNNNIGTMGYLSIGVLV